MHFGFLKRELLGIDQLRLDHKLIIGTLFFCSLISYILFLLFHAFRSLHICVKTRKIMTNEENIKIEVKTKKRQNVILNKMW